jgi:peptidase E
MPYSAVVAGHIVAMGGGPLLHGGALLEDELLRLAGVERPRVRFLCTAAPQDAWRVVGFYEAFSVRRCDPAHVELFGVPEEPLARLAEADVVYVSGGNSVNMLAVWRVQGAAEAVRAAWERGAVLGGWSAGGCCWFESFVTDSFGAELQPYREGLGLVPGSFCPHYDSEPARRPAYEQLVRDGLQPGYAADDGAAAVFGDEGFVEAIAQRPGASVYRVTPEGSEPLATRLL